VSSWHQGAGHDAGGRAGRGCQDERREEDKLGELEAKRVWEKNLGG
jgi:hypothetical protein